MPTPRMPSQSQIKSQMRAAQRKAEQQIQSEVRKAEAAVRARPEGCPAQG